MTENGADLCRSRSKKGSTCRLKAGHPGPHRAGSVTWKREGVEITDCTFREDDPDSPQTRVIDEAEVNGIGIHADGSVGIEATVTRSHTESDAAAAPAANGVIHTRGADVSGDMGQPIPEDATRGTVVHSDAGLDTDAAPESGAAGPERPLGRADGAEEAPDTSEGPEAPIRASEPMTTLRPPGAGADDTLIPAFRSSESAATATLATGMDITDPRDRALVIARIVGGVALIKEAMGEALVQGVDYGLIPGTQRPSLWQPGAEKIRIMFDFSAEIDIVERHEDWTKGQRVFAYRALCTVKDASGRVLMTKSSTCSTEEEHYASAHVERERGGRTLRAVDPADQRQVVEQMAQKRAFVSAIRNTAMASEIFTQDDELVRDAGPRGGQRGGQGGRKARFRAEAGYGECPVHRDVETRFFEPAGKGQTPMHPYPVEGGGKDEWCIRAQVGHLMTAMDDRGPFWGIDCPRHRGAKFYPARFGSDRQDAHEIVHPDTGEQTGHWCVASKLLADSKGYVEQYFLDAGQDLDNAATEQEWLAAHVPSMTETLRGQRASWGLAEWYAVYAAIHTLRAEGS